ncbi:reverse transcriptase family protein [Leisingera caerulea]|uniref:RNA-directed DNA polymerase n=1 Tax=Leisingera caerulea TaxID=506591 RepID=A0A9Q9HJP5_LEICA|nr:reverse transcriptase family protein [Leisingera caerulea]UWQ55938.1 reverse transcriptase family protein [Leisingera caerulea]
MRFPHPDFSELCLFAQSPDILIKALGELVDKDERQVILEYCENGLPPVTSVASLAAMTGFNPGFIWSIVTRPHKHYRTFEIPKGNGSPPRIINAPKVGLKAIQSWLSLHLVAKFDHHPDSFGFIPGKSHAHAARRHVGAEWVISADIENFFPSIQKDRVFHALLSLGYKDGEGTDLMASLLCFNGALSQGSPASPVLSNVVLKTLDERLSALSVDAGAVFTRYADDIVFSGKGELPNSLLDKAINEITNDGWTVAGDKIYSSALPARLKVHGLLVHGDSVRLTKGYRNRIRAYRHLLNQGKISQEDMKSVLGHISYADFVEGL